MYPWTLVRSDLDLKDKRVLLLPWSLISICVSNFRSGHLINYTTLHPIAAIILKFPFRDPNVPFYTFCFQQCRPVSRNPPRKHDHDHVVDVDLAHDLDSHHLVLP